MPTFSKEDISALTAVVTIEVSKDDYMPSFDAELKKVRKNLDIKGFRKGKVPMGLVRSRFGSSIFSDTLNKFLNESLNEYIKEEEIRYLAQPLPVMVEDQVIDVKNLKDAYTFKYEIGLEPEFEIKGFDKDTALPFYMVDVQADEIEQQIEDTRKRFGGYEEQPEGIIDGDVVVVDLHEADAEGNPVEGGLAAENSYISIERIKTDAIKEAFTNGSVNATITIDNIFDIEDATEAHIRKHILRLEDDTTTFNATFNATIKEVKRVKLADLNEELFKQIFPEGDVTDEATFRERVEESFKEVFENNAKAQLGNDIMKALLTETQMELPDEFLLKFLKAQENADEAAIDKSYPKFAKNLRWQLIRNKLATQFELNVQYSDVQEHVRHTIARQYNVPVQYIQDQFVNEELKKEGAMDHYFNRTLEDHLLDKLVESATKEEQTLTREAFNELNQTRVKEVQELLGNAPDEEATAEA